MAVSTYFEHGLAPHHWWAFVIRGIAAIIFGVLAFVWPGLTLAALIFMFAIFALVNGIMAIISAIRTRGEHVWLLLLEGILGIVAGLLVFSWPGITALLLVFVIGVWAVLTGVLEVISAMRLRKVVNHEWAWVISGVLSVVFGVLIMAKPGAGALALVWLIGAYAVLFGISMFAVAWRVYEMERSEHGHPGSASVHQPVAP
jgi:uncharacterized membrane protein HdeD (DUF308 family)